MHKHIFLIKCIYCNTNHIYRKLESRYIYMAYIYIYIYVRGNVRGLARDIIITCLHARVISELLFKV